MYVVYKIVTPKKLTKEQKNLIEKLANTDMETKEVDEFKNSLKETISNSLWNCFFSCPKIFA